jgi:ubiquinone/menaquinone biosynthesis C-methylase UbiE
MSGFDLRAADWDTPERVERATRSAAAIRAAVPMTPSTRVIDIGSGTGLLGLALLPYIGSLVLADPSAGMTTTARSKIEAAGLRDVEAIAFDFPSPVSPPGAPFDLAVSLMALHHVEDTAATLRSIHALLAVDGRIALIDLEAEDGSFHDSEDGIHHHGFEASLLRDLATEAGFGEVGTAELFTVERNGRPYPLLLLTGRKAGA